MSSYVSVSHSMPDEGEVVQVVYCGDMMGLAKYSCGRFHQYEEDIERSLACWYNDVRYWKRV
jgi:hypothetical protein